MFSVPFSGCKKVGDEPKKKKDGGVCIRHSNERSPRGMCTDKRLEGGVK